MIAPESRCREAWNYFVFIVAVLAAVEVPLRIAFGISVSAIARGFEAGLTTVFVADLVVNLVTRLKVPGASGSPQGSTLRRYLCGWFFVDLIAAIPITLVTGGVSHWGGINRLLKLAHFPRLQREWQRRHMMHPSLFRLFAFILLASVFSHWTACGWIWLGGGGASRSPDLLDAYVEALYWTITTLATVGYGDITPQDMPQRIFAIFVMIAGVGSYGYIIANVAGFIANMDLIRAQQKRKIDEVISFLNYRSVPLAMQRRVIEFYRHLWESDACWNESKILEELPESLRSELEVFMHRALIRKVPFLRDAGADFIAALVRKLRPSMLIPNTCFIRKGEPGDSMYFVGSGLIEVVSEDGAEVYATMGEGDFVGEMAMVLDRPRTASVRTVGYCDLYVLEKSDFLKVLEGYPEMKKHIETTTHARLERVRKRDTGDTGDTGGIGDEAL